MNKKGDLPTMLLFFISLILIVLALFMFATFNDTFSDKSKEISNVMSDIVFYQDYIVKKNDKIVNDVLKNGGGKEEIQRAVKEEDLGIEGVREYFRRIAEGDFKFRAESGGYIFRMDDLFIESKHGANVMKRYFDLFLFKKAEVKAEPSEKDIEDVDVYLQVRFPGTFPKTKDDNNNGKVESGESFEIDLVVKSKKDEYIIEYENSKPSNNLAFFSNNKGFLDNYYLVDGRFLTNQVTDMDLFIPESADKEGEFDVSLDLIISDGFNGNKIKERITFGPFKVGEIYDRQVVNRR